MGPYIYIYEHIYFIIKTGPVFKAKQWKKRHSTKPVHTTAIRLFSFVVNFLRFFFRWCCHQSNQKPSSHYLDHWISPTTNSNTIYAFCVWMLYPSRTHLYVFWNWCYTSRRKALFSFPVRFLVFLSFALSHCCSFIKSKMCTSTLIYRLVIDANPFTSGYTVLRSAFYFRFPFHFICLYFTFLFASFLPLSLSLPYGGTCMQYITKTPISHCYFLFNQSINKNVTKFSIKSFHSILDTIYKYKYIDTCVMNLTTESSISNSSPFPYYVGVI